MVYFLIGLVIVAIDFFTKILAKTRLQHIGTVPVIEDVFHLTYVENKGAAFGILQEQRWFFVVVAVIFLAVILALFFKYRNKPKTLNLGLSFMAAGAFGNTIDRVWQGYVVDFFDFRLIDFPVFNVADIFVCIGAGLLAIFFVFIEEKYRKERENHDNQG